LKNPTGLNCYGTYNGDVLVDGNTINGVVMSGDNIIDCGFTLINIFVLFLLPL